MLKIKNHKILLNASVKTLNQEYFLSGLLAVLLGRDVEISQDGASDAAELVRENSFFTLKGEDGICFGIDFSGLFPLNDSLQFYLRLATLASSLKKAQSEGKFKGYFFCENVISSFENEYQVFNVSDSSGLDGKIVISKPANYEFYSASGVIQEKVSSDNKTDSDIVSLHLGHIQVDLSDFINIKSGMEIEFELPEAFQAQLGLGKEKFAQVSASIAENKIKLRVVNVEC